jgi:hypothetical protein
MSEHLQSIESRQKDAAQLLEMADVHMSIHESGVALAALGSSEMTAAAAKIDENPFSIRRDVRDIVIGYWARKNALRAIPDNEKAQQEYAVLLADQLNRFHELRRKIVDAELAVKEYGSANGMGSTFSAENDEALAALFADIDWDNIDLDAEVAAVEPTGVGDASTHQPEGTAQTPVQPDEAPMTEAEIQGMISHALENKTSLIDDLLASPPSYEQADVATLSRYLYGLLNKRTVEEFAAEYDRVLIERPGDFRLVRNELRVLLAYDRLIDITSLKEFYDYVETNKDNPEILADETKRTQLEVMEGLLTQAGKLHAQYKDVLQADVSVLLESSFDTGIALIEKKQSKTGLPKAA